MAPRALLIVNPYSTRMDARTEDAIVDALSGTVDVTVERTRRGGHATQIARQALAEGSWDIIIACGGDGTGNEVVSGLGVAAGTAPHLPLFALLPAGGTNVFSRALGYPNHPVKAARHIAQRIANGEHRMITIGRIDERAFIFAAGVGFDATIIKRTDQRRKGRRPSDLAHLGAVIGTVVSERFRFEERLTVHVEDTNEEFRAAMVMCANLRPFSFIAGRPVDLMPHARVDGGLDFVAPTHSGLIKALRIGFGTLGFRQERMERLANMHSDVDAFTIVCDVPMPVEADGEYLGERSRIRISAMRDALRVIA